MPKTPPRPARPAGPSVLHLLAPAKFGGLETVVRTLAGGQRAAGMRVHVAAVVEPGEERHPFLVSLSGAGVPCHALALPTRAYLQERREVGTLLDRLQPTVLHTHGYRPDVVDAPVARSRGVATVTTVHGFIGGSFRGRIYEWLQRRAYRSFDAVLAVSRAMVPVLEGAGVPAERIHVVPNAWEPSVAFLPPDDARRQLDLDRRPVVGWVGRISPEKGPDLLVRSAAALSRPEVAFAVVGTGPARASATRLAGELGVGGQFRWHGRVEEAARLMRAFEVLALPSRTEGTPMVLFEATAAGVPVVATEVGGVPDVLGSGENVVPPGRPEAFARAVQRLLDDPAARSRAVERARERIREAYGLEAWIGRHREIYESVGPEASPSPPSTRRSPL